VAELTLLLADTSAWHRSDHPDVSPLWRRRLEADAVATTEPVRLEVLYSARSPEEYDRLVDRLDALRQVPCGDAALRRALEVQRLLARRPLHHRVPVGDLLIASAAELSGATVWHYNADYDRIAGVTGQPVEWIAPRGSL
jgi:predicted nucleic acid-binding protein